MASWLPLITLREAVGSAGASAVALGSMVVFEKKGLGVLVSTPDPDRLSIKLGDQNSRESRAGRRHPPDNTHSASTNSRLGNKK